MNVTRLALRLVRTVERVIDAAGVALTAPPTDPDIHGPEQGRDGPPPKGGDRHA